MSLLLDHVPLCVFIDGQAWPINADFRTAILFEQLLCDDAFSDAQRVVAALALYYPVIPSNFNTALDKIAWFYRCAREPISHKGKGGNKPLYDFEQDGDMIYAAFKKDYNIDLEAVRFLHWWKFKALFENLHPDNIFCKIMEYRGANTQRMKGDQKAFYVKMQQQYAIKRPKAEQERDELINNILLNDGDLSAI